MITSPWFYLLLSIVLFKIPSTMIHIVQKITTYLIGTEMKNYNKWISILLFLIHTSANANDDNIFEDVKFVTGLSLGYSNLYFPEKLDHEISFPSANINGAVISGPWQLSLNG